MPSYSTIEEKAIEWNISARHIQYLCRTNKIEGAVKRAGAWAIPDDTQTPAKNTKVNTTDFKFVGTKSKIFDSAIKLFVEKGFNNVSFKDIANEVGIRQSTVYSHFKTKQDILDALYDYYSYYYIKERISLEDMERIIKNDSLTNIMECIRYEFKEEYRQKMSDITKIIFQRISVDSRASEIAKSLVVDEGIRYVESIFNRGVEIGRFGAFDTHLLAVLINVVRIFTLYHWIVNPEFCEDSVVKLPDDEMELYKYALRLVQDLNPRL